MRPATRIATMLVLAITVFVFSSVTFVSAKSESKWIGGVYGNTEIWGLNYIRPFTYSSHYVLVSNESGFLAKFLYEFKASILGKNFEKKVPANPHHANLPNGKVEVKSSTISIDMRDVPNLRENDVFTLDCYTRIDIQARRGRGGWKVGLKRNYLR